MTGKENKLSYAEAKYGIDRFVQVSVEGVANHAIGKCKTPQRGVVKRLDHLFLVAHDPEAIHRIFVDVLKLPEVRPFTDGGFFASGMVYAGNVMTMPGLGRKPAYKGVDLDADGLIQGLF